MWILWELLWKITDPFLDWLVGVSFDHELDVREREA
jgi:hypothetical protein